jgi:hypothetical protein
MTFFVSGHRDITTKEFEEHYIPTLDMIIENNEHVVVGDCPGVDEMTLNYLWEKGHRKATVYYIGLRPMNNPGFAGVNYWFDSDENKHISNTFILDSDTRRDFVMTMNSDQDIAWLREGNERSGTGMNVLRREWLIEEDADLTYDSLYEKWEINEANQYI